ncbi:RICIN domain-containing protein [Streptomyces sp. NPDC006544]|uniref:RICIN domain-containing protein n=1 Tax=Streptomyces sp. NPDC006544 TaxID=3154583 RepID=UPI0033AD3C4E
MIGRLSSALVIAAMPGAAMGVGTAPAGAALVQLTFTNVSNNKLLDVQNGDYEDNAAISVNPAPGSATTWRINTGTAFGSGFAIVTTTTGKCMDLTMARYQLRQQPCKDSATCSWYTASQTPPFQLPETCISPIWFNDTSTTIP